MATVIRVLGFANNTACPHADMFVTSFDHDAHDGQGDGTFSHDIGLALRFDDLADAIKFYRKVSDVRPLRPDGEPNRPLTCVHASFEHVSDETPDHQAAAQV